MSEEEERTFLEEAYNMSLDSPDIDKKVNNGTAAPNCQPKHTREEEKRIREEEAQAAEEGLEVIMSRDGNDAQLVSDSDARAKSEQEARDKRKANKKREKQGRADTETEKQKLSYFQMARIGYQELVNAIIRPPRADYKEEALGPPAFTFCGRRFTRTDFTLQTKRGLNLQCSHWEPVERTSDRIPVVIYMHGNSSARVEVLPQLSYLLSLGLAVFSFDFAGSGKSDGEYVSLGYYEREDLMCVIAHLRATNVVSTIALWGRSMGAATSLMHGDRDPSIACMILDSPFADLTQLAEEMVEKAREQGINVPNFVVSVAIRMIKNSVQKQANFNIKHISPIAHADKCFIPALFVAGEHDDFIDKKHSEAIHAKYAGDKNLIIVEGDHNSPRPKFMFDSVSIFLQTCLQIPNSWALRVHPGMNLMAPPWYYPGVSAPRGGIRGVTSPQRKGPKRGQPSNEAAEAAAAAVATDADEMGMTLERQKEIQASLFKMLGSADDGTPASGEGGSKAAKTAEKKKSSNTSGDAARDRTQSVNHASTFPPSGEDGKSDGTPATSTVNS